MALNDTSNPWTKVDTTSSEILIVEDVSGSQENDADGLHHLGDYSTHMEELFEGDEGLSDNDGGNDDDFVYKQESEGEDDDDNDDDDGFVYDGVDANASVGYKAQLRDVLGQDLEDSESEVIQADTSLVYESSESFQYPDEPLVSSSDKFIMPKINVGMFTCSLSVLMVFFYNILPPHPLIVF